MFSTGWPPSLSATRFLWTRTFQADWVLASPHTHMQPNHVAHTQMPCGSPIAHGCTQGAPVYACCCDGVNLPVCDCFHTPGHCPFPLPLAIHLVCAGVKETALPASFLLSSLFPIPAMIPPVLVIPFVLLAPHPLFFPLTKLAIGVLAKCRSLQEVWTLGYVQVLVEPVHTTQRA